MCPQKQKWVKLRVLPQVPVPKWMLWQSLCMLDIILTKLHQQIWQDFSFWYSWGITGTSYGLRTVWRLYSAKDKIKKSKGHHIKNKETLVEKKYEISSLLSYGWRCAYNHTSQSAHRISFVNTLSNFIRIEIVWVDSSSYPSSEGSTRLVSLLWCT